MRLLYLAYSQIPSTSANSVHVMKMCQAFTNCCSKVMLISRNGPFEQSLKEYYQVSQDFSITRLKPIKLGPLSRLIHVCRAIPEVLSFKADVVFGRDMYLISLLGILGIVSCPVFLEVHVPPKGKLQSSLLKRLFRSKRFNGLVVITESLKTEYLRIYGELLEGKIHVAPDGADVPDNDTIQVDIASERCSLGYIGSLNPGKGATMIMDIALTCLEYEFHIVGGSEEQINDLRNRYNPKNVVFHGHRSQGEIGNLAAKVDILLAPYQRKVLGASGASDLSRWMSPLKIFEYMAFRKPIIVSDLEVLLEVMQHERNCLIALADDVSSWSESIERLIDSKELREKLVKMHLKTLRIVIVGTQEPNT